MKRIRNTQALTRFFSGAGVCMLAMALVLSSGCGPLCAGMQCADKSMATDGKPGCHGMAGHVGIFFMGSARAGSCALANGAVAMLAKPVVDERAQSDDTKAALFLPADDMNVSEFGSGRAVASRATNSPPLPLNGILSTVVLRV